MSSLFGTFVATLVTHEHQNYLTDFKWLSLTEYLSRFNIVIIHCFHDKKFNSSNVAENHDIITAVIYDSF